MKSTYYSITFEKLPNFKILGKPLNRHGSYIKDHQGHKKILSAINYHRNPSPNNEIQTQAMRSHIH